MLDITNDIQSLTTFRRRSGDFMKQLKKTKRPVVLTVKGKAAAIVQDAEAYQRLLDIAARADAVEGIRQGIEHAKQGKIRPAREFFEISKPAMAYFVNLTGRAQHDLSYLYREIDAEHSAAALKWYRGLKEAILSLEERPNRCPLTPESKKLRHLLYRNKPRIYRVIHRVRENRKQVDALHIRHGARRRLPGSDITQSSIL